MDRPTPTNPKTPDNGGEKPARLLLQLNQRLLHLSEQMGQLRSLVDSLSESAADDGAQLSALVGHLTDTQSTALLQRRLAELTEQMSAEHDQLNFLGLKLTEMATQDQLVRMASTVATNSQVQEVLDIVHNLARTQEVANKLAETRQEHIEALMGTLREIVVHRQKSEERSDKRSQEEIEEIRTAAKGEVFADLLPVLDGLDVAQEHAHTIAERQRQNMAMLANTPAPTKTGHEEHASAGLLDKLRSRVTTDDINGASSARPSLETMAEALAETEAWLNHVSLVRDRFTALLAMEGVEALPAVNLPFDPRFHIAIESEIRTDVEPNTIVRELRKGYRQKGRVLRYSEVVIAQALG